MKVYKITLYVSLIVFSILTVLSVALNFWNENEWIAFVVNWCVGIACSIVVVIITTLIQFKVEQKKAINKLILIARALIFHNEFFGSIFASGVVRNVDTVTDLDKIENNWRNSLKEDMEKASAVLMELEFFFKNPAVFGSTPRIIFNSLEPWSIIRTLIPASPSVLKSLAEIPIFFTIPCPTIATSAISVCTVTKSGFTVSLISFTSTSSTP